VTNPSVNSVPRHDLRSLLRAMAPESLVPCAWVLATLDAEATAPRASDADPTAFLTVAEMAALARCGESTVRGWLRLGLIPGAVKVVGLGWRVTGEDFSSFLEGSAAVAPTTTSAVSPIVPRASRRTPPAQSWEEIRGVKPRTRRHRSHASEAA
jgi:hypothetical protein